MPKALTDADKIGETTRKFLAETRWEAWFRVRLVYLERVRYGMRPPTKPTCAAPRLLAARTPSIVVLVQ